MPAIAVVIAVLITGSARADDGPPERSLGEQTWQVVAYLPNRLFDLCDVVRLRARVGTGFSVGARITRYLPVFVGSYHAFWLGLPGPRGRAELPIPAGFEKQRGIEIAGADVGKRARAPSYGVGEIGAGVMVYFVGVEIGVDPYELADFLAGILLVDFAHDDF